MVLNLVKVCLAYLCQERHEPRSKVVKQVSTHGVEPVVHDVFQVLAHAYLLHELVLVPVHARQLAHVGKHVLDTIGQLQHTCSHMLLLVFKDWTFKSVSIYMTQILLYPHPMTTSYLLNKEIFCAKIQMTCLNM